MTQITKSYLLFLLVYTVVDYLDDMESVQRIQSLPSSAAYQITNTDIGK